MSARSGPLLSKTRLVAGPWYSFAILDPERSSYFYGFESLQNSPASLSYGVV